MNAVAVAIRKSDPVVSKGAILELGLALVDVDTGVLSNQMNWLIKPIGFEAQMSLARLSALMDSEALGPENSNGLATDVMMGGQSVNDVIKSALHWWELYVKTDRYTEAKPDIIGFNPETTRQWVNHWFGELGALFGQSLDLYTAAWAIGIEAPAEVPRVMAELQNVSAMVAEIGSLRAHA